MGVECEFKPRQVYQSLCYSVHAKPSMNTVGCSTTDLFHNFQKVGFGLCVMLSWTCTSLQLTSPQQIVNDSCTPEMCTGIANKLVCRDCIPDNIPNVTEVNLVGIHPLKLVANRFCYVNWPNVNTLFLTTADNIYFILENGVLTVFITFKASG